VTRGAALKERWMKLPVLTRYGMSLCAVASLLSGCGGSQLPAGLPGATAHGLAAAHDGSWMLPEAKTENLLYVSGYSDNEVFVYDYATGKEVGMLAGFERPYGQCVDARGDVWIADTINFEVKEYQRGGTSPVQTLNTQEPPLGCSVDPTTGNVAVGDFDFGYGFSELQIYKNGSGSATDYSSSGCFDMWSPGYDSKGNLYVECQKGPPPGAVWELPHGGDSLRKVSFDRRIYSGAGIMWDGKYLAVTTQPSRNDVTEIYVSAESSSGNLKVVHTTHLSDSCAHHKHYADVIAPFIVGKKNTPDNHWEGKVVVGGNFWCDYRVDFWSYPRGGSPTSELKSAPLRASGQSVSLAP
jgi:hypothetical protein